MLSWARARPPGGADVLADVLPLHLADPREHREEQLSNGADC